MVNVADFKSPNMFGEFSRVPLCFAWQNDAVWFLYLVLKTFSVSRMHVSEVFLS